MTTRLYVLALMFWAWVGGVCCDQAVEAWVDYRLTAAVVWSTAVVLLAGSVTGMYLRGHVSRWP